MTELQKIDNLIDVQLQAMRGMETDAYMRGMYNGMEMIRSVIAKAEPVFIEKDGKLDVAAVDRNPERYL